jgi:hypothetical protein
MSSRILCSTSTSSTRNFAAGPAEHGVDRVPVLAQKARLVPFRGLHLAQELRHPRFRRVPRGHQPSQLHQRLLPPLEHGPAVGLQPLDQRQQLHELVVRESEALLEVAHDVGVDHLEGFVARPIRFRLQERGGQEGRVESDHHSVLPCAS